MARFTRDVGLGKTIWKVPAVTAVCVAGASLLLPILPWLLLAAPWSFVASVALGLAGGLLIGLCIDIKHPSTQTRLRYGAWPILALAVLIPICGFGVSAFIRFLGWEATHDPYPHNAAHSLGLIPIVQLEAGYFWFIWGVALWWLVLCFQSRGRLTSIPPIPRP